MLGRGHFAPPQIAREDRGITAIDADRDAALVRGLVPFQRGGCVEEIAALDAQLGWYRCRGFNVR